MCCQCCTEKQIQTCLFVHQLIVVGEEGSELCGSVGQNLEDIWQKAPLQGHVQVTRHTTCVIISIPAQQRWIYKRQLMCSPWSPLPPLVPRYHTAGLSCTEPDSDWFSPVVHRWSKVWSPPTPSPGEPPGRRGTTVTTVTHTMIAFVYI